MRIEDISVRNIFDSRGDETIEVGVAANGITSYAQIPAGKSRGLTEVVVLPYRDVERVVADVLRPKFAGKDFDGSKELDAALTALDATPTKSTVGGNVMLGVSIAFARGLAAYDRAPLWKHLANEFFPGVTDAAEPPLIFSNMINGGAHAENNLDIQEYLVVAKSMGSVHATINRLIHFYRELGSILRQRHSVESIPTGDEAGYSLDFRDNLEPLEILEYLIHAEKLEASFLLGVDVAASHFWKEGKYFFDGKRLDTKELGDVYAHYFHEIPLLHSVEDPFAESDEDGFRMLQQSFKQGTVVGDDITTTNPGIIERCAERKCIGSVIIKPNQIGTVTETCAAIHVARRHNLRCIISHRSGETEDTFIVHLAKASGAEGIKIGAPRNERISKFNELIRLYD